MVWLLGQLLPAQHGLVAVVDNVRPTYCISNHETRRSRQRQLRNCCCCGTCKGGRCCHSCRRHRSIAGTRGSRSHDHHSPRLCLCCALTFFVNGPAVVVNKRCCIVCHRLPFPLLYLPTRATLRRIYSSVCLIRREKKTESVPCRVEAVEGYVLTMQYTVQRSVICLLHLPTCRCADPARH